MPARRSTPRLRRSDEAPPVAIQLTNDDVQILWHVFHNRLIDSESIYKLFPGRSEQQLSRRLQKLFHAHYVGRPPRQVELFVPGGGLNHFVYGLDREGARLLSERFGARVQRYHWLQKNNELTRTNIDHTLSTTRFMVELEMAAREHSRVRVVTFEELLATNAPSHTRKLPMPERIKTAINWNGHSGEEGTIPDRIFGLEYLDREPGKNRAYFFLEIDEGHETVEPGSEQRNSATFFRRSSILRKFIVYAFAHRERFHEKHFGWKAPARILIVTTSAARVKSMQQAYERHLAPQPLRIQPGLLLFTDRASLREKILRGAWSSAAGNAVALDGS